MSGARRRKIAGDMWTGMGIEGRSESCHITKCLDD